MAILADVKFPALRVTERGILKCRDAHQARLLPERSFNKSNWLGSYFLGEDCHRFDILGVASGRRSFNPVYLFGPQRMFIADYDLSDPIATSYLEVRNELLKRIVVHGWFLQGGETEAEFKERFQSYDTMMSLLDNLSGYGVVWY
jgi:hypothetical protein